MPNSSPHGAITADQPLTLRTGLPPAGLPRAGLARPGVAGGGPEGPSQDSCPLRDWGCVSGVRRPSWQLLSSHRTSEGEVEYCRCSCAALVVLHRGELASFTCPPDDPAGALPPGGGVPGGPPSP